MNWYDACCKSEKQQAVRKDKENIEYICYIDGSISEVIIGISRFVSDVDPALFADWEPK